MRQALATKQPTFIDDGNGAFVAAVERACTDAILDALEKDPESAKVLTAADVRSIHAECVAQQGVRAI